MKIRGTEIGNHAQKFAIVVAGLAIAAVNASAASYEWTFNSGNLSASLGAGVMTYADGATTAGLTSFGTTGGGVPNIGGQAAKYMYVPAFSAIGNGYNLELVSTGPNGGGSYVNNYTMIFDILIPSPWPLNYIVPFFNTEPANGNDADFYLYGDGEIGIGGGGYSAPGTLAPDTWYRVAFVNSGTTLTYYVNGTSVHSRPATIDGTWSLYSNLDPGHDLRLFNEGDGSGQYTHELYLNSVAFVDSAMSGAQLSALGGPNAGGIFVPEPTTASLLMLGFAAAFRRFCGKK